MEQEKHRKTICKEADMPPLRWVNRESDDKQNNIVSQEMMDTDKCIQRVIRSEPEGSDHIQQKIEDTAKYSVMKEGEAVNNYHCTLELNKAVSDKRVQ